MGIARSLVNGWRSHDRVGQRVRRQQWGRHNEVDPAIIELLCRMNAIHVVLLKVLRPQIKVPMRVLVSSMRQQNIIHIGGKKESRARKHVPGCTYVESN